MKLEYALVIALIASVVVIGITHIGAAVGQELERAAGAFAPGETVTSPTNAIDVE